MPDFLRCGRFRLALDRPLVMGVVNVTPDSFYDGGRHASTAAAIAHARRLVEEGADLMPFEDAALEFWKKIKSS